MPQDLSFSEELESVAGELEESLKSGDLEPFYAALRRSRLPFIPCVLRDEPELLYRRVVEVVRRLGGISPAVALAVENHYYVTAALATMPLAEHDTLLPRREELIDAVMENRWLVANTNSRVHADKVAATGTVAKAHGNGYRISGRSAFMSLATEGDLIVFITHHESGEPAIFACPLKGNPRIEIGPFLFPEAMVDSDTRSVTFDELEVSSEHLLISGREHHNVTSVLAFEMTWHQSLLGALGLGIAARAIEEARLFLRAVRRGDDGVLLAELDGMIVDVGRLAMRYKAAASLVEQTGAVLANVSGQAFLDRRLAAEAFEQACVAKYVATHCAEETVATVRKIIGPRAFVGGHPIERLSQEGAFIPMAGEVSAFIERKVGGSVLGERSFLAAADGEPDRIRPQAAALERLRARAKARRGANKPAGNEVAHG